MGIEVLRGRRYYKEVISKLLVLFKGDLGPKDEGGE